MSGMMAFMRRGLLRDYANALCGVATGWQMEEGLDLLREHGVGVLELDVLGGTASIDGAPVRMAGGVALLRSWLLDAAQRDGVAQEAMEAAKVTVAFDCEEETLAGVPLWRFEDYRCQGQVSADGRVATGDLHKTQVGIYDRWNAAWTIYEGQAAEPALAGLPGLRQRYRAALDLP